MVRDTGVDLMTFGLTKDGAMYGETVVFLRPELAERAVLVRKQAGQLSSKARFVAAQIVALLDRRPLAAQRGPRQRHGAPLAAAARDIPGVGIGRLPEVNAVFATVPAAAIEPLQAWSFFWEWDLTVVARPLDDQLRHHRGGRRPVHRRRAGHRGPPRRRRMTLVSAGRRVSPR